MSILSGFSKFKRYRKTSDGYKLSSEWTSSDTVEMGDGNTLEENLGSIKGITSSLTSTSTEHALAASAGSSLQAQVDELNTNLSHVGMVIHSTTLDTMEKVIAIYGGTKWEKIEGRFLLGSSSDYAVDSTGGASSVLITPSGTVDGTALTVAQLPAHSHGLINNIMVYNWADANIHHGYGGIDYNVGYLKSNTTSNTGSGAKHTHTFTGTAQNVDTIPPYKAVYIWERTA